MFGDGRRRTKQKIHFPPHLPAITRVTTIKIPGVAFTNSLSVAEHVHNVISSCAQVLHALRVLRAHGMDDASLQTIYRSVIIAKLTYASSAWWGTPVQLIDNGLKHSSDEVIEAVSFQPICRPLQSCAWQLTRSYLRPLSDTIITFYINSCRHNPKRLNTTIFDNADITLLSM